MINFVLALVFLTLLIFQTTLFKVFGTPQPDAALLAAVYFGINLGKFKGYQFGILAGLAQDLFSYGIVGLNLLSKGLIGFTSGWLRELHLINLHSPLMWGVLIFFSTLWDEALLRIYFFGFYGTPLSGGEMIISIIFKTISNFILALPLFYLLNRMQVWLKEKLGLKDF